MMSSLVKMYYGQTYYLILPFSYSESKSSQIFVACLIKLKHVFRMEKV